MAKKDFERATIDLIKKSISTAKSIEEKMAPTKGEYANCYHYVVVTAENKLLDITIAHKAPHLVNVSIIDGPLKKKTTLFGSDIGLKTSIIAQQAQEFIDVLDGTKADLMNMRKVKTPAEKYKEVETLLGVKHR